MLTTDEIVAALRSNAHKLDPVALAELLDRLTDGGLSQSTFITYFKRAFSSIPLRVLLDAKGWHRLCSHDMADEEFRNLLGPWLKAAPEADREGK